MSDTTHWLLAGLVVGISMLLIHLFGRGRSTPRTVDAAPTVRLPGPRMQRILGGAEIFIRPGTG
jgi:hypothetical protein